MRLMLLLVLFIYSIVHTLAQCGSVVVGAASQVNALQNGITFTTNSEHLCAQIGGIGGAGFTPAMGGQMDTGSNGIVLSLPWLNAKLGGQGYTNTGLCGTNYYISSLLYFYGPYITTMVRIYGADGDGRYVQTKPLPVLGAMWTCTGTCTPPPNDCSTLNSAPPQGWTAVDSSGAPFMFGVGWDRDNIISLLPFNFMRSPFLSIDASPLPVGTTPSGLCGTILGSPSMTAASTTCTQDQANPNFSLPLPGVIPSVPTVAGYVVTSTTLRFVVHGTTRKVSSPIFSCGSLQSYPQDTTTPANYKCWRKESYRTRFEILTGSTLDSATAWTNVGYLLPDTGIPYLLFPQKNYPCATDTRVIRITIPVSTTNVLSSTSLVYTFATNFGQTDSSITNTQGTTYYVTSPTVDNYVPPSDFRVMNSTCSNTNTFNSNSISDFNTGRNIVISFAYYVDFTQGVVGFAPVQTFNSNLNPSSFTTTYYSTVTLSTTTLCISSDTCVSLPGSGPVGFFSFLSFFLLFSAWLPI
eukprot:TRINITY_DN419_c0_g1_i1.p1 TRINITY_DN419_c0_g1~~TRINITY_DN419_c0_g1_i1.p1  ORF type:complete len:523 (-),score=46.72 TRINITY_DN419_c0_g1_i1:401-1969(-)